jgi:hypothetical protein
VVLRKVPSVLPSNSPTSVASRARPTADSAPSEKMNQVSEHLDEKTSLPICIHHCKEERRRNESRDNKREIETCNLGQPSGLPSTTGITVSERRM